MPKINWKEYNEKLVKRGEILFNAEFIENWKIELNSMNEKKREDIPMNIQTHTCSF